MVYLKLGDSSEQSGMVSRCIRTNGEECEDTSAPEQRSFHTEHGKGLELYPESMSFGSEGTGSLILCDESGVELGSTGGIVLLAKGNISLDSKGSMDLSAMTQISVRSMLAYTSGFCVNDRFDYLSTKILLRGDDHRRYPPFEDAPVKGEFNYKLFFSNLFHGVEVVIEMTILAAIAEPAAPALMNGSISALVETLVIAAEDFESGNVRSAEEAEWLIDREAVYGTVTGAVFGAVGNAFGTTPVFENKVANTSFKALIMGSALSGTGIEFRKFETRSGLVPLSGKEAHDYIYNWKTIMLEFGGGAGASIISDGLDMVAERLIAESKTPLVEGGTDTGLFLPDEFYDKHLPSQVAPGTKYLPKYDEFGNVKQIKMYDDYGREIGWVDYTNHGYGDINSPDYHTVPHWHERIYNSQYRDGMKINHRTDINTPLGDK